MAPHWPEEVDVFTVPHSRMKKLINQYNSMVMSTDFRDEMHLMSLLQNLNNVFNELKAHERIENIFIMRELRSKLRAASISDPAVCNCHSDNRLTEMQDLVLDGYKWAKMPQRERQMYGRKLRQALENFTENFLPHMDMEEQVFQPMLMEYFSYEELKALKVKVIKQHGIYKYEESSCEKFVADSCESEESSDERITKEEKQCQLDCLPNELCLQILSWLGPQDMGRMNQVSRRWANLTHDPKLWTGIFPVHWAMGNWSFHPQPLGEDAGQGWPGGWQKEQLYFCTDEDADVDESGGDSDGHTGGERTDSEEGRLKHILQEAKLLTALVKHVLPKVGSGVRQCDLAFSRGLSNNLVHKILKLCPNLEILDLKQTLVGDAAFREFGVNGRLSRLRHLDLSGCENISDLTLYSLASLGTAHNPGFAVAYSSADTTTCSESEKGETDAENPVPRQQNAVRKDTPLSKARNEPGILQKDEEAESDIENVPHLCQGKKKKGCCGERSRGASLSEQDVPSVACCKSASIDVNSGSGAGCEGVDRACCHGKQTPCEGVNEDSLSKVKGCQGWIPAAENLVCVSSEQNHCDAGSGNLSPSDCSDLHPGRESDTENCASHSCLCDKQTNKPSLSNGCHSTSNSNEGDSNTCDLSFVYLDMLIQSDESAVTCDLSPGRLADSIPAQTNLSRTVGSSASPYILVCDEYQPTILPLLSPSPSDACKEVQCGSLSESCDESSKISRTLNHSISVPDRGDSAVPGAASSLEFLSLSGCYRVTSDGLRALSDAPGMPRLRHLDLSGCVNVCGDSLRALVLTAPGLDHADLYYCDNIPGDPFPTTASGCRNRGCCGNLYCCSLAE